MTPTYIYNGTKNANNEFQSGYRAYADGDNIVVEYLTNYDGHACKRWVVEAEYFYSFGDDLQHNCMCVENACDTK